MAANPPSRRDQLRQEQAKAQTKHTKFTRAIVIGVVALAVLLVGIFAYVGYQANKDKGEAAASAITPPNAVANGGIAIEPGAPESAPEVIVYVDYQCPACAQFEAATGEPLASMARDKEIRLSQTTMTFMDRNIGNDSSTRAANAAVCADQAGICPAFNTAVFANQSPNHEGYSEDLLRNQLPTQLGLQGEKLTKFQQCVDGSSGATFVEGMNKSAYDAGVTATPTITVNGKPLDNSSFSSVDALKEQIRANA